jgi:hypothetical protein
MAAAGVMMVASHSPGLTVKSASTTKIDNAIACPLVLTGSVAAVATAAIWRLINSLSDKLPDVMSSPNRGRVAKTRARLGQGSDVRMRALKRRRRGSKPKARFGEGVWLG